jgi:hypothetical protein
VHEESSVRHLRERLPERALDLKLELARIGAARACIEHDLGGPGRQRGGERRQRRCDEPQTALPGALHHAPFDAHREHGGRFSRPCSRAARGLAHAWGVAAAGREARHR